MNIRATNNYKMLKWARDDAGLSLDQAAAALSISEQKLIDAENGDHQLTLNQLRKASKVYCLPFGYFYLTEPPSEIKYRPVPDYRVDPNYVGMNHPRLNLEIKKCRDRRETYLELAQLTGQSMQSFERIGNEKVANIGSILRKRLSIDKNALSSLSYDKTYNYWKSKIEEDGVLVYESQYVPETTGVIGASLFYENYPIILMRRGGPSKARRLFTLLHEYAHLLLGESAINDEVSLSTEPNLLSGEDIESRCNKLASEILAPSELVDKSRYEGFSPEEMMEALGADFRITYSTAAVCLKKLNLISQQQLSHLLQIRRKAHQEERERKPSGDLRIPREVINKIDLGKPLFEVTLSAYSAGVIDIYDASKLLQLRISKIDRLVTGA